MSKKNKKNLPHTDIENNNVEYMEPQTILTKEIFRKKPPNQNNY